MSKNVFVTFGSYHSLNIVLLNIGNLTKKKNIWHGKIYSRSQEEKMSNRTLLCNKLTKKQTRKFKYHIKEIFNKPQTLQNVMSHKLVDILY